MNTAIGNVFIKYNPYTVETIVRFDSLDEKNGEAPKESSKLHYENLRGKRLQEWVDDLPIILEKSGREKTYTISFFGTTLDYEDIKAVSDNSSIITRCEHLKGSDPEEKLIHLKELFEDAKKLGFESIDSYGEEIDKIFKTPFEAYVVATMSAGKSTLINSLLGQKLMPSTNRACTATITRILNTDNNQFSARAYGENRTVLCKTVSELTYDEMVSLNSDKSITDIDVEGNIPFVNSDGMPFLIVDTPGPNNSRNTNHKALTMRKIESGEQSLIIFLIDATQDSTDSEKAFLDNIAEAMKKGGKMSRDRFLFVFNKLDNYLEEPWNIEGLLSDKRRDLEELGIRDARIYPVSANMALTSKIGFGRISPNLKKKYVATAEAMVEEERLHLETPVSGINSHIPVSARIKLKDALSDAIVRSDLETQALIHSGVPSLEFAIKEYLDKYAHAMKVGEAAEKLRSSFNCAGEIAKLENIITTDSKKREEIIEAIAILEKEINSGNQGKIYEERLNKQIDDALLRVKSEISELQRETSAKVNKYNDEQKENMISPYTAEITFKRWKGIFENTSNKLRNDLSALLNKGVKDNAEEFLNEYRRSIEMIMPKDEVGTLPFNPLNLLGGTMTIDTVISDFTVEKKKEARVITGVKKEKNPEREGFFGFFKFGSPWYIEVPVYETRYTTKKYVKWEEFAQKVIGQVREAITKDCVDAKNQARINSENMVNAFKYKFKALNNKILEKTNDLIRMSDNDGELKERIAHNEHVKKSIEEFQIRLNEILEI